LSSAADASTDQIGVGIVEALEKELAGALLGSEVSGSDVWVRVDRAAWRRAVACCRDGLGFNYFTFLSGIDWKADTDLAGEKLWDPNPPGRGDQAPGEGWGTGLAGGDSRFQVMARLQRVPGSVGVTLKADLDEGEPRVDSIVELFRGADWHERETWEMYGFVFDGHPGLRHIYLPTEFEGFPLRKDFPLLAREVKPWPGLVDVEPMPGEPEGGEGPDAEAGAES